MKRIVTLLLAAGLVLGATMTASAADIKVKGNWTFSYELGSTNVKKHDTKDNFGAMQRMRTQVDIIASESLKGVVFFEIGTSQWGNTEGGASLGTDGNTVKVRYSYIDWIVPNTDLKVRMGLQPFGLPSFNSDSVVYGGGSADSAAIVLNYTFNENVGMSVFWSRPENNNATEEGLETAFNKDSRYSDALDTFGFTVPVTLDGFKVTPWVMFASVGRDSMEGDGVGGQKSTLTTGMLPTGSKSLVNLEDRRSLAWWGGVGAEMTYFAPFRLSFDGVYGSVDYGNNYGAPNIDIKRAGWYTSLLAEYKLDMMTPGLMFWYASGDDNDSTNGSERLPSIRSNYNITTYGFSDVWGLGVDTMLANTPAGLWGVQARLKDISFLEDLKHTLALTYSQGTNNTEMVRVGYAASPSLNKGLYLTTSDSAWEVNLDSSYKIYKDLEMVLELSYLRLDLDEGTWGDATVDGYDKNDFRAQLSLQYKF